MGAEICGDPRWLASGLQKLEHYKQGRVNQAAEAHPASAHMFIVNPLSGLRMDALFSTHPPTEERVARLLAMAPAAAAPQRRSAMPRQYSPWGGDGGGGGAQSLGVSGSATKGCAYPRFAGSELQPGGCPHDRPHREEHRAGRARRAGLARADRPRGVRRLVPGEAGRPVRARGGVARADHLSRLRAPDAGRPRSWRWSRRGCSPSPGIPMPSIPAWITRRSRRRSSSSGSSRRRAGTRLTVVESGFDALPAERRRGPPHERGRLGGADQEHQGAMSRAERPRARDPDPAPVFAALGDGTRLVAPGSSATGGRGRSPALAGGHEADPAGGHQAPRVLGDCRPGAQRRASGRESRFALPARADRRGAALSRRASRRSGTTPWPHAGRDAAELDVHPTLAPRRCRPAGLVRDEG